MGFRGNILERKSTRVLLPHLQPGGVTAEVRRVDEAEAKDSNAATVEGSDVT